MFFSQSSWYILVNEKLKTGRKKKSRPPDWLFWQSPGGQETIFHLRMAWGRTLEAIKW